MQAMFESAVEFLLPLVVGLVFLLWGRRLFWLLGGLVFAILGLVLVALILDPNGLDVVAQGNLQFEFDINVENNAIAYAIGVLLAGAVGIFCTLKFPRAASAVVGFAIGAFFLLLIFELFALEMPEPVRRTLLIIVGTIVALIAIRQPAETMIILSVMLGSKMVVDATKLDLNSPLSAFIWLIAMLVGIIYQTSVWRREQRKQAERLAAAVVPAPV